MSEAASRARPAHRARASRPSPGLSLRAARAVRYGSLLVIAASLAFVAHRLGTERIAERIHGFVDGVGAAGPLALGAVYVLAALLLLPPAVLTIAAGALYGLGTGTVIITLAANVVSALSFVIARYAARGRVERAARAHPRFAALDEAVTDGGWKVVLAVRLSPFVPFTVANYLFGLTGVRFASFVLGSVAGMLPGTLALVYVGHVGAESLLLPASGRTPAQWALLLVGLAASVVASVWFARLARRRLEHASRASRARASRANVEHRWGPSVAWLALALASAGSALGVLAFGAPPFGT